MAAYRQDFKGKLGAVLLKLKAQDQGLTEEDWQLAMVLEGKGLVKYLGPAHRPKLVSVFDPTQLAASAFALTGTGEELTLLHSKAELTEGKFLLPGEPDQPVAPPGQAPADAPRSPAVIITLHGIRTTGKWQKVLTPVLSEAGLKHYPLDYGRFLALHLLIPTLRRSKVEWFLDEYQKVQRAHPHSAISLIAHSYGTYMAARALSKYHEIHFDKVIFCGSIVPREYDWSALIIERQQVTRVLHDFGDQDFWAWLVEWLVTDAGSSGRYGFTDEAQGHVLQQRHQGFQHSDHFYDLNYQKRWIPFLQGTDPDPIPPHRSRPFNWKPLVVVLALLLTLALGYYYLSK